MEGGSVMEITRGDVLVVIPARDEAERIAATVEAALVLPGVRDVAVVDDGSRDGTADAARAAGARVLVLKRNHGKGGALDRALRSLAAEPGGEGRYLLFLDADLGASAANAAPLIEAVHSGGLAMAIAAPPPQPGGGHGFVVRLARKGIRSACGFEAEFPLSGQRCLTRAAYDRARPLAWRFGVEVGLTIDLVRAGYAVAEVSADLRHRVTGKDFKAQIHRARQYRDVWLALAVRKVRKTRKARK
jgi:glycosyltransferase involved in cell wall biosynthesis